MGFNPQLPNKYLGTDKTITFFVTRTRSPTGADYRQPETGRNYPLGCVWQTGKDPSTGIQGDLWMLSKIVANVAYWVQIASGVTPSGGILTISDSLNTLVYPSGSGNVQIEGTAGEIDVVADPANNKVILSLPGGGGAIDSINVQAATVPGVDPVEPDADGLMTVNGAVVANHSVPIESRTRALNTYNIEAQYGTVAASTDGTKVGLLAMDSASFGVDAVGFTTLKGANTCAFLRLASGTLANVTGDGTNYTVVFDTSVFDVHNDCTSTTFTAPFTGLYYLQSHLGSQVPNASGTTMIGSNIVTTARIIGGDTFPTREACTGFFGINGVISLNTSGIVMMTAGDTAEVHVFAFNGTKTTNLIGSTPGLQVFFAGYRIA